MTAKVWSALVTYEQLKTAEKMTPGLSRMAFWWDPVPTDTSTSWFPCGPRYMSTLRKDNCSWLVKKSSSCRPRHVPGLFLFVHETKRCFQKAELGFVHVACTTFLHEGIWHLKLSCLSKPHQAPGAPKKPGLAPAMGMWSCSQHWQKPRSDKSTAHPIQCWCCKVQACQWTDFDQKKERKKPERVHVALVSFQNTANSLLIPVCELSGWLWRAAEWQGTKSPLHGSVHFSPPLPTLMWLNGATAFSAWHLKGNEPHPPSSFPLACWSCSRTN